MTGKSLKVFVLGAVFLALAAGLLGGFIALRYTMTPASESSNVVIFEVVPSMSFATAAQELEKHGVIKNANYFYWYARVKGMRGQLRVGEYELNTNMVPGEVLGIITSGKSRTRPFLVPEGYNIFEVADLFERQGFGKKVEFMALVNDKAFVKSLLGEGHDSLEGYLFPENYSITKFMSTRDILTVMVRQFQSVYKSISAQHQLPGWTTHQVVTLASIIEKETGAPHERRIISSVFHNRLAKRMRLQTDPTVIYGMALQTGQIPKNIRKKDLLEPTRYNTYVINGLPPGPIANPGREALIAAFTPEKTNYLYFVSRNDGTHIFTPTYEEHNKAVRTYQLDPNARKGKSWRDLNKNK